MYYSRKQQYILLYHGNPVYCNQLCGNPTPGAYEGFCLGWAQFARKNFFGSPPWQHCAPFLKTCFVHHKNTPKRLFFWGVANLRV